jgi:hypothetical protein
LKFFRCVRSLNPVCSLTNDLKSNLTPQQIANRLSRLCVILDHEDSQGIGLRFKQFVSEVRLLRFISPFVGQSGLTNFEVGVSVLRKLFERFLKIGAAIESRDSAKRALMEAPEISPEQLEAVLSFLQEFPYRIREMLPEVVKTMPHEPGGRPRSLTEPGKQRACAEIALLYGQGVRVGVAIKRVAQKFGVSERTIRRAWRERASRT